MVVTHGAAQWLRNTWNSVALDTDIEDIDINELNGWIEHEIVTWQQGVRGTGLMTPLEAIEETLEVLSQLQLNGSVKLEDSDKSVTVHSALIYNTFQPKDEREPKCLTKMYLTFM